MDCFFRIGKQVYHFASNGQPIPAFITRKRNIEIQDIVNERLQNTEGEVEMRFDTVSNLVLGDFDAINDNLGLRNNEGGLLRIWLKNMLLHL